MLIYYWGTYDRDYPRNRILRAGLRANGAKVIEFHFALWKNSTEKVRQAGAGWVQPQLFLRWLWAYAILSVRFLAAPRPDFLMIGYSGHFDMFPAWCLGRLRRVPLVFDAFLSLHDSLVQDRVSVSPSGLKARFLAWVDRSACRLADRVLLDTHAHAEYFCRQYRLPRRKFWVLPIGADDEIFRPSPDPAGGGRSLYTVLHFGRYIPLHGLETVVRAAHLLEEQKQQLQFILVGDGEERSAIEDLVRQLGVTSIRFRDPEAPAELVKIIQQADLCLGIFGATGKAKRVIPNKVYESMAVGKPVVTGDSPAARELLRDGTHCLLCEMNRPESLAAAILTLQKDKDMAGRLAENGRRLFNEKATPKVIGSCLYRNLESWGSKYEKAA